jgi:CheY-like chemotaxis protein
MNTKMTFSSTHERPVSEQMLAHRLNAVPEPTSLPDGSGRTVLVVDDNVDAAATLAALLEASGFHVLVAHDGPSALALSQEWAPDYALLDIGMPAMDGYELAAHLRFAPGSEHMKVIAVTGRGLDEDARESRAKGFAAHLVKPVDLRRLGSLLD